jgi:hypothetical protein
MFATIIDSVFSGILIIPAWLDPIRKHSLGWIANEHLQIAKVVEEK